MRRNRLNLVLVGSVVLVVAGTALGVKLLHRHNTLRAVSRLAAECDSAVAAGGGPEAAALLKRYLAVRPADTRRAAALARVLLARHLAGGREPRQVEELETALRAAIRLDPAADDLRESLATLLVEDSPADEAVDEALAILDVSRDRAEASNDPIGADRIDLVRARVNLRGGRSADAQAILDELTHVDPLAPLSPPRLEAIETLAGLREEQGLAGDAGALFERLVRAAPADPRGWMLLAEWHCRRDRAADASAALAEARAVGADTDAAATLEARIALVAGDPGRAAAALATVGSSTPERFAVEAALHAARGDTAAQIDSLRAAVAAHPREPLPLRLLLAALCDARRVDDLRGIVPEGRLRLGADAFTVVWAEAQLAMADGRWLVALRGWESLLARLPPGSPATARAEAAIAVCLDALGEPDRADAARARALGDDRRSLAARLDRADALEEEGDLNAALAVVEHLAARVAPADLATMPELWNRLFRLRVAVQAAAPADRRDWSTVESLVAALDGGIAAPVRERLRIDLLAARGERDSALAAARDAVATHPAQATLRGKLALLLAEAGQPADALPVLDAAPDPSAPALLDARLSIAARLPGGEGLAWLESVEAMLPEVPARTRGRLARRLVAAHATRGDLHTAARIADGLLAADREAIGVAHHRLAIAAELDDPAVVGREAARIAGLLGEESVPARLARAVERVVAVRAARGAHAAGDPAAAPLGPHERRALDEARTLAESIVLERPRFPDGARIRAAVHELDADPDRAIAALERAVELGDPLGFAGRRLVTLLVAEGRSTEAARAAARLPVPPAPRATAHSDARASEDQRGALGTAVDLAAAGRPAEAEAVLRESVATGASGDPRRDAGARRRLARLLARKRYADVLEAVALLEGRGGEAEATVPEDVALASRLLADRPEPACWRRAVSMLEGLAALRPLSVQEEVLLAGTRARLSARFRAPARTTLERLVAEGADGPGVLAALARTCLDDGDVAAATAWIARLEDIAPAAPVTVRLRLEAARASGDDGAVESILSESVLDPRRLRAAATAALDLRLPADDVLGTALSGLGPSGELVRARLRGRVGDTDQAVLRAEAAGAAPLETLDALVDILDHASGGVSPEAAAVVGRTVAGAAATAGTEVRLRAAILADATGDRAGAIGGLRDLLAEGGITAGEEGIAAGNLAYLLLGESAEESAALVARAIDLVGPLPDLLDTRALVRAATGDLSGALEDAEEACLSPAPRRLLHLAALRARAGDADGARRALDDARKDGLGSLRLDPSDRDLPAVAEGLPLLRSARQEPTASGAGP